MSAVKQSIEGENPPPRPALPKKEKSEKPVLKAKAKAKGPSSAAVEKIRNTVTSASHDQHPGHNVHARGHKVGEEVRVTRHNHNRPLGRHPLALQPLLHSLPPLLLQHQ